MFFVNVIDINYNSFQKFNISTFINYFFILTILCLFMGPTFCHLTMQVKVNMLAFYVIYLMYINLLFFNCTLHIVPSPSSLSARILHRAPPPRLQVDQNFLTQKIVADPKMRCHQKSFGIWRVTEAILGQKIHNKSHYFFNF